MVDEHIIQALRGGTFPDGVLDRIRVLLRAGTSPEELARRVVGVASFEGVGEVMSSLEALSSQDMELSLKVMIGLYPVASDVLAHDVCSAIELWLEHEGTPEVRDLVASLLTADPPFGAREKLESWMQLLADR